MSSGVRKAGIWSKNMILVLLVGIFAGTAHQSFNLIFPVYILDIGYSNALTGALVMALTIADIAGRFAAGSLIDRWGRKKMLMLGSGLFFLSNTLYLFVDSVPGLFVLRIISGLSQGLFFPVTPTIVSDNAPEGQLNKAITCYGIAGSIPYLYVPTIGLWLYQNFGSDLLFTVAAVFSFAAVLLCMPIKDVYVRPATEITERKVRFSWDVFIFMPAIVAFLINLGNSSIQSFLTPCGLERGLPQIGLYFTFSTIFGIAARLLSGWMTRKLGELRLMGLMIIFTVIGTVIIAFCNSLFEIILAALILSSGITLANQLLQVYMLKRTEPEKYGFANSMFMVFQDIGFGIGSLVWGAVSGTMGYTWMFLFCAGVTVIAWAVKFITLRK